MDMLLVSESPVKTRALQEALDEICPLQFVIKNVKATPGLPAQPVDCGRECAEYRMMHAKQIFAHCYVAIESAAHHIEDQYQDIVDVVAEFNGYQYHARSYGVICPLNEAQKKEFESQQLIELPGNNIHGFSKTGSEFSDKPNEWNVNRQAQIKEAVIKVLRQMLVI